MRFISNAFWIFARDSYSSFRDDRPANSPTCLSTNLANVGLAKLGQARRRGRPARPGDTFRPAEPRAHALAARRYSLHHRLFQATHRFSGVERTIRRSDI